jgi:hypothetical protein
MERAISHYLGNERNRLFSDQTSEAFKKWEAEMKSIANKRQQMLEREFRIERLKQWQREQVEETIRIQTTFKITNPKYIISSDSSKNSSRITNNPFF